MVQKLLPLFVLLCVVSALAESGGSRALKPALFPHEVLQSVDLFLGLLLRLIKAAVLTALGMPLIVAILDLVPPLYS